MKILEKPPAGPDDDFLEILEKPSRDERITVEEGERLLKSQGTELGALIRAADRVRRKEVGEEVTYVINRNINFTNACENSCRFCAFEKTPGSPGAYTLDPETVGKKAREAASRGATEVCLQGGLNPGLGLDDYLDYLRSVREAAPGVHLHAYSPAEIDHAHRDSRMNLGETIERLKGAGLGSVPGTAAEVFSGRVRRVVCPGKIGADRWEEIVRTCHGLGVPTTSTMLYGHVETAREISDHLRRIGDIQEETNGFTEFVPLPLRSENTELGEAGLAKNLGPEDHLRVHAAARLMLSGLVENVQASWVKLGSELAGRMLGAGANDLSGTLMEENITRAAGGELERLEPEGLEALAEEAGRPARERTTTYGRVRRGKE